MRLLAATVSTLALASTIFATPQQARTLRLKVDEQATYHGTGSARYEMSGMVDMKMSMKMKSILTLTPEDDDTASFTYKFEPINFDMKMLNEAMPMGNDEQAAIGEMLPTMLGVVNHLGEHLTFELDIEEGSENPFSSNPISQVGLQGIVFPDKPVRPGDTWDAEMKIYEDANGMADMFMMMTDPRPIKFLYLGDEVRNGRTLAKVRMTMRFGLNSESFGAPEAMTMSLGAGYIFYIDVETGIVRFTEGSMKAIINTEGTNMDITMSTKMVTDIPSN